MAAGRTAEYSDGRSVVVLCPACGGTGLAHCCDGERAQKNGEVDEVIVARCDMLIVAHLPGWQNSKGMAIEIAFFEAAGKPIFDLNPESLTMARR